MAPLTLPDAPPPHTHTPPPRRTAPCRAQLFEWDTYFSALQVGFDERGRDLAFNTYVAMTKSATLLLAPGGAAHDGFVPNFAAGAHREWDRTEPPVGANVLLELLGRWGAAEAGWLVDACYGELRRWNDWLWRRRRRPPPLGLLTLGSDPNPGAAQATAWADTMAGATLESGCDNSRAYCDCPPSNASCVDEGDLCPPDGRIFDAATHQMQLYDVGTSALFAQEAEALATLADAAGRPAAEGAGARARERERVLRGRRARLGLPPAAVDRALRPRLHADAARLGRAVLARPRVGPAAACSWCTGGSRARAPTAARAPPSPPRGARSPAAGSRRCCCGGAPTRWCARTTTRRRRTAAAPTARAARTRPTPGARSAATSPYWRPSTRAPQTAKLLANQVVGTTEPYPSLSKRCAIEALTLFELPSYILLTSPCIIPTCARMAVQYA